MLKKTVALVVTQEPCLYRYDPCFEKQFSFELGLLKREGFFLNWTYTDRDILLLFDKLPAGIRKECVDMYPEVARRTRLIQEYLQRIIVSQDSELDAFLGRFYGKGSSEVINRDAEQKISAIRTGIARYYIFFLLAMNSDDENSYPRILIDNIKSFKDFLRVLQGFPLFEDLKSLHIQGNVSIGGLVTFRQVVEIFIDPSIEYTLAGESTLDNVRVRVNDKGKVEEERI